MNRPNTESPRDDELVAAYLQGRQEAFGVLFQRYKNGIFFVVRNYFPNRERAEEVFQEVFLKLLERLGHFDGSGSFRGWFFTLCRNHCIDRLRQQARRPETPDSQWNPEEGDGQATPVGRAADEAMPADERAYDRELAAQLEGAIQKLPEEQRETFLLKERGGLTFEEIAKLTGVSINTVKSRMRYALEALRRSLRHKSFVKEALQ
ncbi:MAG: sigma-70 family RNA polymerase sigma factor [Deltaproteobacteria bacterium]|nr:sigma-70 family RNA polymerase sigma factor [Deltaproteobacteria bacterium]